MKLTSSLIRYSLVTVISLLVIACATPFKKMSDNTKIDKTTASRITVDSVMPPGLLKSMGVDFSGASVNLNGEFIGDFSKNEKTFSIEVNQGMNRLFFCTPNCFEYKIYIAPNTHYFLQYEQDRNNPFLYKNSVKVLKNEPYNSPILQSK